MAAFADPVLLARAVAGDDGAFAALVEPYQRPVFRHCYRMLGSGADAEDATQDTLERAWRKLLTYDGSGPFGARQADPHRPGRLRASRRSRHDARAARPGTGVGRTGQRL